MSAASYTPRHSRALSPPASVSSPSTVGPQTQRLNIVTRLAIEGSAKRDENVPIKMYMKLAVPVDNVVPGCTIPLFKEDNVKIIESEVHPLDSSSVPYNFSSGASPLLHNAARALSLPARSPHSYLTLFDQRSSTSSHYTGSLTSSDADVPALDEKYTGHILVSGYQVSFVLPSEFPPSSKLGSRLENGSDYTPVPIKLRGRRSSISEKNVLLFMAGISMMVPYLTRPQRAPWLLSIPTPRCLSNTVKLRIFPPDAPSTSSSFQSLSSGDGDSDPPSWDMTADPHVTRMTAIRRSPYQYQHFADDESSDSTSAPGFSDGVGIQGTFPSTERVRVRWATPVRSIEGGPREGRRRVGVTDARGEMFCTVLGRARDPTGVKEGVLVHVDYKASCQGVWYPGVATLLGMDVGLEARGCDVSWARGSDPGWEVSGGIGYTGHEIGGARQAHTIEKQTSFDMPTMNVAPNLQTPVAPNGHTPSRQSSISSTASLLRAPLPSQNVPEYSFESTPTTPGSETGMSSIFYNTTDNDTREPTRASSVARSESDAPLPSLPITLHLNINDLLPPNKTSFTFSLRGIVLIAPRSPTSPAAHDDSSQGSDPDDESRGLVVSLPRFRVLAADSEKIETTVRNGMEASVDAVDLYTSSDPKARKTELARGARSRTSSQGGRVALRPLARALTASPLAVRRDDTDPFVRPASRARTPDLHRTASIPAFRDSLNAALKLVRDGPLMIPYVDAVVTPLSSGETSPPHAYAVCVKLPAPADVESEWLDFGLGHASPAQGAEKGATSPMRVQIVSASLDGVPIKYETTATANTPPTADSLAFERMSGKAWETWVRVRTGASRGGGSVEIMYIVKENNGSSRNSKGKERARDGVALDIILPAFSIPVGRLQVKVEVPFDFEIASLQSNLTSRPTSDGHHRLDQFALGEFFYSQIRAHIVPRRRSPGVSSLWTSASSLVRTAACIAPAIFSVVLLILLLGMYNDIGRLRSSIERCGAPAGQAWAGAEAPTVTITATVVSRSTNAGQWVAEPAMPTEPGAAADPAAMPTPTSVTMIDVSSPSSRSRGDPLPPLPPPPPPPPPPKQETSAHGERYALSPIQRLPLLWPIQFEIPFTREQALEAFNGGLNVAWQVLRRIYHYPLDPP
ncbi:hypothetical protein BC834DRAFT_854016 [Gloeopeniophorella convolvens]|nr:hypothetical protein BC834DRAFT_854016 [Gloeopeniophorella convolvens]